ncbi:MAG: HlyD family efflux transporter periplasmic adaptor subunit [Clostridiaceae bacterium]
MKNFKNQLRTKGKIVLIPMIIMGVLLSVYIFNRTQNSGSALVYAEDKTYLEASGTVESNSLNITSEVSGNISESLVSEGDQITQGDVIARIGNTTLTNQQSQAEINVRMAQKKIETLEKNFENLKKQNSDAVNQAENNYRSVTSEYQKIKDGSSSDQITQAQELLNQAKINRDYLKVTLADAKDLLDDDRISQSKYDEIKKNYDVSKAQYNAALSQLKLIKAGPSEASLAAAKFKMLQAEAGFELAKSNGTLVQDQMEGELEIARIQLEQNQTIVAQTQVELDKLAIKSPISGTVDSILVKQGEFAQMGKVLAQINDDKNLTIRAYVSEANIAKVKVGQAVEVYTDADATKAFKGSILRISSQAEFTPKNIQTKEERMNTVFEVKIQVLDPEGSIKAGMPVDIRILVE